MRVSDQLKSPIAGSPIIRENRRVEHGSLHLAERDLQSERLGRCWRSTSPTASLQSNCQLVDKQLAHLDLAQSSAKQVGGAAKYHAIAPILTTFFHSHYEDTNAEIISPIDSKIIQKRLKAIELEKIINKQTKAIERHKRKIGEQTQIIHQFAQEIAFQKDELAKQKKEIHNHEKIHEVHRKRDLCSTGSDCASQGCVLAGGIVMLATNPSALVADPGAILTTIGGAVAGLGLLGKLAICLVDQFCSGGEEAVHQTPLNQNPEPKALSMNEDSSDERTVREDSYADETEIEG